MVGLNEQIARDQRQEFLMDKRLEIWGKNGSVNCPEEGALRFLEEALEAVQYALPDNKDIILRMVDYVWGRPVGEIKNELGGASITLLMYAESVGCSLADCERTESHRMMTCSPEQQVKWEDKHLTKIKAGITYHSLPKFDDELPPPDTLEQESAQALAREYNDQLDPGG